MLPLLNEPKQTYICIHMSGKQINIQNVTVTRQWYTDFKVMSQFIHDNTLQNIYINTISVI